MFNSDIAMFRDLDIEDSSIGQVSGTCGGDSNLCSNSQQTFDFANAYADSVDEFLVDFSKCFDIMLMNNYSESQLPTVDG